nr:reverse transcriptase domain-containing protein [Tanacetum cinerariifolium]
EDDADDEDEDEEDEEDEEEEHLASTDVAVVVPTVEPVSLPEGTEPVIPPPYINITTTGARINTPPAPHDEDEHELVSIQPHDPDFVPEPIYHKYIPIKDEHILPAEEQPLPPVVSPTTKSLGYVAESNPEEDPEEYEDDETEDGSVDHPMDDGDDGDDDDIDSSGYNADGEDKDEKEEEEEHLAPTDSVVVIPTDELVSPLKGTELIIPPPSTDTATTGARITIRPQTSISLLPEAEAEVERLLAMPTPPPSPLTLLSPPSAEERLARDDIPETELPPRKKSCWFALGPREAGYGIRDTWVDPVEAVPEIEPMTLREVNTKVTELAEIHEHDIHDLYALLEDAQASRTCISQRVTMDSQRMQQTEMEELRETDHRCQAHMVEILRVMGDMRREMGDIHAELLALQEQQRRARQPGLDARVLDHQDAFRDADSHIYGLPDNIYESVKASRPKTLNETIELANDMMDQKLCTYTERQTGNKRKADDSSRNNHGHQQNPSKRQNVAKVYNMGSGERNPYEGNSPKCTKCHFHHNGPCTQKCHKCNKIGDCPKLKNKDGGNVNAQGWVYAVGNAEKKGNASRDSDSNVITADGKIIGVNTIIRGYTLNFMNHPFNIDLMPVPLGSFDVIIEMDWLTKYHGVIICDEKIVRVPFEREMLIFQGNGDNQREESQLNIISCTKAQEYFSKGCDGFLAHITTKKAKDKSEGKRLEDVPMVRYFPEVFPEDLPGIPPARQVEF